MSVIVDVVFALAVVIQMPNGGIISIGEMFNTRQECLTQRSETLAEVPALKAKIPGSKVFVSECVAVPVEEDK